MIDPAFTTLQSPRLQIRRFVEADARSLAGYRSDPEVARYQGWDVPYSTTDARAFIASLHDSHPGEPGSWYQFAVTLTQSDHLIGDCALCPATDDPSLAELGFSFASAYHGFGYAREAVAAVLRYAVRDLCLGRFVAITDHRNVPARRLLAALGFEESPQRDIIPPSGRVRQHELLFVSPTDTGTGS